MSLYPHFLKRPAVAHTDYGLYTSHWVQGSSAIIDCVHINRTKARERDDREPFRRPTVHERPQPKAIRLPIIIIQPRRRMGTLHNYIALQMWVSLLCYSSPKKYILN